MSRVLSIDALKHITDAIINDYSKYIQHTIDAESARSSIGYQVSLLRSYEYIVQETNTKNADDLATTSIVVLPKSADLVDITLLLNVHEGVGRYFLTLRREGRDKYAVHNNKLYYIDPSNPSRPFDIQELSVSKKYLANSIVNKKIQVKSLSVESYNTKTSIIPTRSSSKLLPIAPSRTPTTSPKPTTKTVTAPVAVAVWSKSTSLKTVNDTFPASYYCPTNNGHCCYTKTQHPTDMCTDPATVCCINAVHYPGK